MSLHLLSKDPYAQIIDIVLEAHTVDVAHIDDALRKRFSRKLSKASLYRRISELVDAQVFVRYKRRIALNHIWVSHIINLARRAELEYGFESSPIQLPTREGQKKIFKAPCLAELDTIWNHIHMLLGVKYEEHIWYGYNAHSWFALGAAEKEQRLHESLVANGFRYHLLYGNNTFLDAYGRKAIKVEGYHSTYGTSSCFNVDNQSAWAGTKYTIEVRLPDILVKKFASFFEHVSSIDDFDAIKFEKVFYHKVQCELILRRSRKQAREWQKELRKYFDT